MTCSRSIGDICGKCKRWNFCRIFAVGTIFLFGAAFFTIPSCYFYPLWSTDFECPLASFVHVLFFGDKSYPLTMNCFLSVCLFLLYRIRVSPCRPDLFMSAFKIASTFS